jgi:hypothetical protein
MIDYKAIGQWVFRMMPLRPMPDDIGHAVVAALGEQGLVVVRRDTLGRLLNHVGAADDAASWGQRIVRPDDDTIMAYRDLLAALAAPDEQEQE